MSPQLGLRVMRRQVLPAEDGESLHLQLGGAADAHLPDAEELLALGRIQDESKDEEDPFEDAEPTDLTDQELWHRGLGKWLKQSTENLFEKVQRAPVSGLVLWPFFTSTKNLQFVLTASAGEFQTLPIGHRLLSNLTGGILDPKFLKENLDIEEELARPHTPEAYSSLFDIRCNKTQATTRWSAPAHTLPPLLWSPSNDAKSEVNFSLAFAFGLQLRLVELRLTYRHTRHGPSKR